MLTLFAAKNTIAVASHIALEETGLPYQINWVDFSTSDQRSAAFLAINPKGRVPALVTHAGTLTETPAILEYIAETSGQLMPSDAMTRARVRETMSYCASTFHVNHAHKFRGARWADDPATHAAMTAKVPQTMAESCTYLESQLSGEWVTSDYSIADIHLFAICRWLKADSVDITDSPKLHAHFSAMTQRAAVQRVQDSHG